MVAAWAASSLGAVAFFAGGFLSTHHGRGKFQRSVVEHRLPVVYLWIGYQEPTDTRACAEGGGGGSFCL